MLSMLFAERFVGVAVIMTTVVVGLLTIQHGDLSLGLLVLLGKIHEIIGRHGHVGSNEATHLVVHQQI